MSMKAYSRSFRVVVVIFVFSISAFTLQAQSFLSEYFETAASAIPNKFFLSAYEEVRYNDNVHDSASREVSSFINEAGISLDWYKNFEGGKYGLIGDISYDYYDKESHDLNNFNWNISPFILGSIDILGNDRLMLSLSSRRVKDKFDSSDTRHTSHIDNKIGLTYDLLKFARWGVAMSGQYFYKYYTDSEFKNNSYQDYKLGIAPYYNLTQKIKLGINNSYSRREYNNNKTHDNSQTYEVMPFIDYRQSNIFSVHFGVGASRTDYEGRSKNTHGDGDWQPVANFTFNFYPVSNFIVAYISTVEWEDSGTNRGGRMSYYNAVRAIWKITRRISIIPGMSIDQQDERNSLYDSTEYSVFANLDYKFSQHFSAYIGYEYEKTKYKYVSNNDYDVNECWLGIKFTY